MLQVTSTCNEWTQKKPAQIQKNLEQLCCYRVFKLT